MLMDSATSPSAPRRMTGQRHTAKYESFQTRESIQKEPLPQNHIFRKHPKILVTPHNSSSTPAKSVAPQILENYKNLKQDRSLKNLVDLQRGY